MTIITLKMKNGMFNRTTNINDNGVVEYDNGTSIKIDIVDGLVEYLDSVIDSEIEPGKFDNMCEVTYKGKTINSSKLYSDIDLMMRNNKILDVIKNDNEKLRNKKAEENKVLIEKENKIKEYIPLLDEMKKDKIEIDPYSLESKDKIKIKDAIKFDVVQKKKFEVGETKFYSDSIDIDDNVDYPEFLQFVGQINLEEFSKYDDNNLLPKEGMLYFFEAPYGIEDRFYEYGKVIYSNSKELVKKDVFIYDDYMRLNIGIKEIMKEKDNLDDRFKDNEYKSFYGTEENKIFGLYTDCQVDDEGVLNVSDNYVILLQIGSNILGEGTTTYLIKEEDLKNKNFDNVIYIYSQS